jgi:beta-glucanase (GH16 family)
MKRYMFNTLLLSLAVALWGCGGGDSNDTQPPAATITVSQNSISVPASGNTYTITVTTTGKEWGAYSDKDFITLDTKNTAAQSGTLTVTVPANPYTEARTGSVIVMSGAARTTISVTQAAASQATYDAPEGYKLVWHDEFDNGSQLNSNDWEWETWEKGNVNNEQQYYRPGSQTIDGHHTTEIKNGNLYINCFKATDGKIYSGRVNAKNGGKGWQYGYFEARMLLPKGKGTWPAYWMMPITVDWTNEGWPKCGEIDIMEEVGCVPNEVSSSLHSEGHNHTNGTQVTKARNIGTAESEYHVYALEWTADYIKTYVDGVELLSYKSDHTVRNYPYDKPFHLIFNLAWGGSWGGMYGTDESALPVTMKVDYIRVFQKK